MNSQASAIFGFFCIMLLSFVSGCDFAPSTEESAHNHKKPKGVYVQDELSIQHGMQLFNQHCASCHHFSENGIGPNLTGVTSKVDKDWLIAFIDNPPALIENGDPRAVELFEKYNQYMPPFPTIKGEDLEHILGFIHKFSEGEKRNKNNRPGGLINPVAQKIKTSNLILVIEEKITVPSSSETSPITRINKLDKVGDAQTFMHDLRGKLYEIKQDTHLSVYLNSKNYTLPTFIDNPGKGTGFGSWAFHPDFQKNGLFYTTHNEPPGTAKADFAVPDSVKVSIQAVLTEWKAENPLAPTFSGTHRELMRVDMVTGAHGFQELTFNPLAKPNTPDYGLLYLGIGDGGAALRRSTILV